MLACETEAPVLVHFTSSIRIQADITLLKAHDVSGQQVCELWHTSQEEGGRGGEGQGGGRVQLAVFKGRRKRRIFRSRFSLQEEELMTSTPTPHQHSEL